MWQHSEIGYLVKFGPGGGVRGSQDELWAHRGVSPQSGIECSCNWPRQMLSIDGADRIFAADWVH